MLLSVILFSLVAKNVFGANILFVSPVVSVSHHIWNEVLVQGLLEYGHNITFLSHMEAKIKSENYTLHRITGFEDVYSNIEIEYRTVSPVIELLGFWYFMGSYVDGHLESDALKTILDYPRDKFDLIIYDLTCGQEFYPLTEYFGNPPVVGVSPFSLPSYILDTIGSHFYFYFPSYFLPYTDKMTLFQRVENVFMYMVDCVLKWYTMSRLYKRAQERFGEDITPFDQMEKNIGIVLANYDPVLEFALPLSPNIIPVGGLHVRRSEKLSNDLQQILDNASDGIIYFSFGTLVQPTWIQAAKKRIFLNVFSELNQTILWKYTGDDLKDIPKNVIIRKWYPQNDILAHKNIQLFITHSGGLSTQEVMYHGVPVLGIPYYGDQKLIAEKMSRRKLGKKLLLGDITEDTLRETILEIISNPIYKQNMQRTSQLFRDQKETPLERALFWIEYVLRNKDVRHLSTRARDMSLFQRQNLDIYGVILVLIIILATLSFVTTKYIVQRLIFKKNRKVKQN